MPESLISNQTLSQSILLYFSLQNGHEKPVFKLFKNKKQTTMNHFRLILILFISSCFLFISCGKDKTVSITGTYQHKYNVDGIDYDVQLELTNDSLLHWIPVMLIPGHTSSTVSYVIVDDIQLRVFNDTDCNSEATYLYTVTDEKLTLMADREPCIPRLSALSGEWTRIE